MKYRFTYLFAYGKLHERGVWGECLSAHHFNADCSFALSLPLCFAHLSNAILLFPISFLSLKIHFPHTMVCISHPRMYPHTHPHTFASASNSCTQSQNNKKAAYQVFTTFSSFHSNFLGRCLHFIVCNVMCVWGTSTEQMERKILSSLSFRSLCRYVMAKRSKPKKTNAKKRKWHITFDIQYSYENIK